MEPVWTEFAIPFGGLALFAVIIAGGQRRPTRVSSLIVLTVLLGLWLFGEGLIWRKRWPSMLRGSQAWANNPGAWEWTGLLLLACAAVAAVAASLRLFSSGRQPAGWACACIGVEMFAAWSSLVNYSPPLGWVTAAIAVAAIWAAALPNRRPAALTRAPGARNRSARVLAITAATLIVAFWVILALLWFVFHDGDNYCGCWADHPDAWQYSAEILVAFAGSLAISVVVGAWLRRNRVVVAIAGILAISAVGMWIALYRAGIPHRQLDAVTMTLPNRSGPTPLGVSDDRLVGPAQPQQT